MHDEYRTQSWYRILLYIPRVCHISTFADDVESTLSRCMHAHARGQLRILDAFLVESYGRRDLTLRLVMLPNMFCLLRIAPLSSAWWMAINNSCIWLFCTCMIHATLAFICLVSCFGWIFEQIYTRHVYIVPGVSLLEQKLCYDLCMHFLAVGNTPYGKCHTSRTKSVTPQ